MRTGAGSKPENGVTDTSLGRRSCASPRARARGTAAGTFGLVRLDFTCDTGGGSLLLTLGPSWTHARTHVTRRMLLLDVTPAQSGWSHHGHGPEWLEPKLPRHWSPQQNPQTLPRSSVFQTFLRLAS